MFDRTDIESQQVAEQEWNVKMMAAYGIFARKDDHLSDCSWLHIHRHERVTIPQVDTVRIGMNCPSVIICDHLDFKVPTQSESAALTGPAETK